MHKVSGRTVTREYFSPFLNFLPIVEDKRGLSYLISHMNEMKLTFFTAVHVVAFEFIGGKKVGQAVLQGDVGAVEPARNPAPHPGQPSAVGRRCYTSA